MPVARFADSCVSRETIEHLEQVRRVDALRAAEKFSNRTPYLRALDRASSAMCLFLLCCLNLRASTENSWISGKVTDPQGAPVAEAHLKLVNAGGASVGEAQSDGQGNFTLDSIEPGQYQI